ncbi:MAG: DUF4149 domain-containing protein [Gemmatimonadaceae bacterium]|jgi:hypothetical protein|nr:DUF4149 domain-containing protein [Gemmatimonadaceae bacterium]
MTAGAVAAAAARRVRERDDRDGRTPAPMRGALAPIVLAIWLGAALLMATTVGQAAFAVLPTRQLAGALVGRILPVVFVSGIVAGVLAHVLSLRAGTRPTWVARLGGLALVGACLVAQAIVAPKIESLRASLPAVIEELPASDPQRQTFGRLHGISVALLGLAMLGATATIVSSLRARHRT